jgi:hypothetical protein
MNCDLIQFLPASILSLLLISLLWQIGDHGGLSLDEEEERTAMDDEEKEWRRRNEWGCVEMCERRE